jgi:hypothetical protein
MGNPARPAASKLNGILIYSGGALYFLLAAAYDWFARHNGVKALSDIVAAFIGFFFIWYGRYIWSSLLRSFTGPRGRKP